MQVIVEGLLTDYSIVGDGDVIVFLHGWGDSKKTFNNVINHLSKKYKCISLDLPGFGGTSTPLETFDLYKYSEFVKNFLLKIGANQVYAFIGHSNGGAITIKGLSTGVLNSQKAVLLAASGVRTDYKQSKKLLRYAIKTAKLPTKVLTKNAQNKLRKKVYDKIGSDMLVAENLQETFKNIVSEDLLADSAMISQRCLLIYGSEDSATPNKYGELFSHQIEHSNLVVIEGAGHFLLQSHHNEVGPIISEFLDKK